MQKMWLDPNINALTNKLT